METHLSGKGATSIPPDQLKQLKSVLLKVMWYNQNHLITQNKRVRKNAIDNIIHYLQKRYQ